MEQLPIKIEMSGEQAPHRLIFPTSSPEFSCLYSTKEADPFDERVSETVSAPLNDGNIVKQEKFLRFMEEKIA